MGIIIGQRFGRLVVERQVASGPSRHRRVECICDCGGSTTVNFSGLCRGRVKSCGCLKADVGLKGKRRANLLRHGHGHGTPTYNSWRAMWKRCTDPRTNKYELYGGRGITVCERWHLFENFLADMGERPEGKTLDRINGEGDYEPSNCRWATPLEQRHNRRT